MKVFYIENKDFMENWITIKEGIFVKMFVNDNGMKMITVREPVDKYRPEHFHDIYYMNVKSFEEKDEIDFLNNIAEVVHERLEEIWCGLEDVPVDTKVE